MDRWKSRGGKSQRREEQKKEDQRRERVRRKKMQVREKVEKSRFTVFFQWFVAPEGRKVGSLKRRVRSHLARWEMKNCTPLWREAHFQVKMYKISEKLHVEESARRSEAHFQVKSCSEHFWCRKSARRCGAKHISKSKCTKHTMLGAFLEVEMSKRCTPLWREAHFEVKSVQNTPGAQSIFGSWDVEKVHAVVARSTFPSQNVKNHMFGPLLDVQMSFCVAGARDSAPCQKWAKREGFVAVSKTMAGVDIWRGSGKMHFAWQAQYKRHVHQRC